MVGKMKTKFIFHILFFTAILLFIYFARQPHAVKFSKDFYYDYESNSIFGKNNLVDIAPEIIEFVHDNVFVAVKQKPKYSYDSMYDYSENYSYKHGIDENYYWVISLAEKKVYGPLLFDEYKILCEKKKVKLKFNN